MYMYLTCWAEPLKH